MEKLTALLFLFFLDEVSASSDSYGFWCPKKKNYLCDKCGFRAIKSSHLKQHKAAKHEGVRYPCDLCDYAATQASSLKKHKESQHERIRHPCDECDFISTTRQGLREHKFRHIKADMQIKQQGKNVVHFLLVDVLTLTIVFCKVTLSQLYEYQPTRLQYLLTFQHIFVISHRKTYFCNLLILKHFFKSNSRLLQNLSRQRFWTQKDNHNLLFLKQLPIKWLKL